MLPTENQVFRYPSLRGTSLIQTMTPRKPDDRSSIPGTHIKKKKKWTWWHPSVIPALLPRWEAEGGDSSGNRKQQKQKSSRNKRVCVRVCLTLTAIAVAEYHLVNTAQSTQKDGTLGSSNPVCVVWCMICMHACMLACVCTWRPEPDAGCPLPFFSNAALTSPGPHRLI